MHKVLITGAFGFVGSNLSAYLANQGFEVWALDIAGAGNSDVYKRSFTWDGLEKIPWPEIDAVIHLAGKAHDTRHTSAAQTCFEINTGLTRRVLEAWKTGLAGGASETGTGAGGTPQRRVFILFSSVKAVADAVDGVLTEDATPAPRTPYGESKLAAESIVKQHRQAGFCPYILRPCMIHGPGNKGNLNLLFKVAARGLPWPLGAFDNRRSFASVGNVCAVVVGLLEGCALSGVYQVADDETLSTNELIDMMAESFGRHSRILKLPRAGIRGLARIGDWLHLPLNSERLKKLTESYVVSNAKIRRALRWERMPVAVREGLRTTFEALR